MPNKLTPDDIAHCVELSYHRGPDDPWLRDFYRANVPVMWAVRGPGGIPDQNWVESYYYALYYLTRMMRPRVAVELGTWFGVGSAHIAQAMQENGEGICFGIDFTTWEQQIQVGQQYPDQFMFLYGRTDDKAETVIEYCRRQNVQIDLVFQDSEHCTPVLVSEWEAYRPLCSENHLWICDDDVDGFPEVQKFIEERPYQHKLRFPGLHYGNCITVMMGEEI